LRIRSSIASSRDMPNRDRRNEVLVARRQARRSAVHRGGVLVDALLRLLSSAVTVRASWLRACSSGSREKNNCAKVGPASSRSRICVRQARAIACATRRLTLEIISPWKPPPPGAKKTVTSSRPTPGRFDGCRHAPITSPMLVPRGFLRRPRLVDLARCQPVAARA
jgi:hypothetical protein